jgi:hypothetical protein
MKRTEGKMLYNSQKEVTPCWHGDSNKILVILFLILNAACSSGNPRGAQAVVQSKVLQQDRNLGGKGNLEAGGE